MADKYIALDNGQFQEVEGQVTSAGAGDAGKIVALNGSGVLDPTLLPPGVGADTISMVTSENLSAGMLVNIYNNTGTPTARKADASNGRRAHGFVLGATTSPASATVYLFGQNNVLTSLTPGLNYYLDTTAGGISTTPPSVAGQIVQEVGQAITATILSFQPKQPVTLA